MKKLLFLLMVALLLTACSDDAPKDDAKPEDDLVKEETPQQDEVKKDELVVKEEPKEEPVTEEKPIEEPASEPSISTEEPKGMTAEEATELIEYAGMGEDDKLVSLSVENGEIKTVIELAPHDLLPAKNMAVSSYSQASDALLEQEGWDALTIEFVGVGTISMKSSEKKSNEVGDYFPTMEIENRLK